MKDNFVPYYLFSLISILFRKGFTLKGKNLLPLGSKFFLFIVDPFSESTQNNVESCLSISLKLRGCTRDFVCAWHYVEKYKNTTYIQ